MNLSISNMFSSDFWEKISVSGRDLSLITGEITLQSMGPWIGVGFCLLLLGIPLSGIQRIDSITQATYLLYVTSSGLVLGLLFFGHWIGPGAGIHFATFAILLTGLGAWRWRPRSSERNLGAKKGGTP